MVTVSCGLIIYLYGVSMPSTYGAVTGGVALSHVIQRECTLYHVVSVSYKYCTLLTPHELGHKNLYLYFARHLSLLLLGVVKPTAIEKHESLPLERALAAFKKAGVGAPSASILESVSRPSMHKPCHVTCEVSLVVGGVAAEAAVA